MFIRRYLRTTNGTRRAYWALVESYRTEQGPRQRIVAWLAQIDEAGRVGLQKAAKEKPPSSQKRLFPEPQAEWVEVNASAVRVENCRRFGGPWLGDEPRRVLDELQDIRVVDVVLPTRQGVEIRKRCVTKPSEYQQILLHQLGLNLPSRLKMYEMS